MAHNVPAALPTNPKPFLPQSVADFEPQRLLFSATTTPLKATADSLPCEGPSFVLSTYDNKQVSAVTNDVASESNSAQLRFSVLLNAAVGINTIQVLEAQHSNVEANVVADHFRLSLPAK